MNYFKETYSQNRKILSFIRENINSDRRLSAIAKYYCDLFDNCNTVRYTPRSENYLKSIDNLYVRSMQLSDRIIHYLNSI